MSYLYNLQTTETGHNFVWYYRVRLYHPALWKISDLMPERMIIWEILASIACDTSLLECTDYRLKKKTFGYKMRERCDLGIIEDARHAIMQCPFFSEQRIVTFNEIEDACHIWKSNISNQGYDIMHILLGKQPDNTTFEEMLAVCLISGKYIICIEVWSLVEYNVMVHRIFIVKFTHTSGK